MNLKRKVAVFPCRLKGCCEKPSTSGSWWLQVRILKCTSRFWTEQERWFGGDGFSDLESIRWLVGNVLGCFFFCCCCCCWWCCCCCCSNLRNFTIWDEQHRYRSKMAWQAIHLSHWYWVTWLNLMAWVLRRKTNKNHCCWGSIPKYTPLKTNMTLGHVSFSMG